MPKLNRRDFLIISGAAASLAALPPAWAQGKIAPVRVVGLKADYIDRPLGLENFQPHLSWQLEADARNVRQTAYRILVASSEEALKAGRGDLWDSGKVRSRKSFGIKYEGSKLVSRQRCWWGVLVWDDKGQVSGSSEPSWWEMGLLDPQDWNAEWLAVEDAAGKADREAGLQWIWGPAKNEKSTRQFRLDFSLPVAAQSGDIFAVVNDAITSAAVKSLWIDGVAVQVDPRLNASRSIASTSDSLSGQRSVFPTINAGDHLLAAEVEAGELPEGMIQGFACLVRLNLVDGSTLRIGSGPHWRTRLADGGNWSTPWYDDTKWESARTVPISLHPLPPGPALHLRNEFRLDKAPLAARLYATALGAYEARLNGRRVGDALLTPEISQYAKRALYRVYDVTALVQAGRNAFGLTVADGWYANWDGLFAWGPPPRRVLAQLELTFADGSRQVVGTGPGWRTALSPIQFSQVRIGEIYDARLEQPGWDRADFDDAPWQPAELAEPPSCRLTAQTSPPIRVTQTLTPHAVTQPKPGVYIFDFGQNFPGWCRLHAQGANGTRIELEFAEVLGPSGELDQNPHAIGEVKRDIFILRGDATGETFEPHFTYRGFRYVKVTGFATKPTPAALEGIVAHSDLPMTGRLRVDAPIIEQTWRNIVWTERSNFVSIPTDCPHREQRGWMGDAGAFWETAAFNMDVQAFTLRHMENVRDDQHADGEFTVSPPEPSRANSVFMPGAGSVWGDAGIILPWTVWRRYGDLAIVEQNWEAMNRYVQSILDRNPDYLSKNRTWEVGDHVALGAPYQVPLSPDPVPTTPVDLISTAYWAHSASLLAQMARATGRDQDAAHLDTLFAQVREAFNGAFVKGDGTVGVGTQCGYIVALRFGLLPESLRRPAAERLAADIRRRGNSLTTGLVGTQFILDVLADAGFPDLVYGLLLRTEVPSWGYMLNHGATTIWETWTGTIIYDGKEALVSQNHYALGSIGGFLFRRIAGIDAATPGFEDILIRPVLDPRVKKGGGDYDSVMGRISTDWEQTSDGRFKLDVTIPANTSARIHLPASSAAQIREGLLSLTGSNVARIIGRSEKEAVVEIGSGRYQFVVQA